MFPSTAPTAWARTRCSISWSSAARPRAAAPSSSGPACGHAPLPKDAARARAVPPRSAAQCQRLAPTAAIRLEMQKTMQMDAAVFRTGESLQEGVAQAREDLRVLRRRQGQRPLAHLEHRPDRDDGAREPAAAGDGDHPLGGQPHREPRRPCARGLPAARRRELAQAFPGWVEGPGRVRFDYRPVHSTP